MDVDAAVTEQVEITIKLDCGLRISHGAAPSAQMGEIAGNIATSGAGLRIKSVLDLIALGDDGGFRKLANVPSMIEMHVSQDHVFDVGWLHSDLRELGIDREIRAWPRS